MYSQAVEESSNVFKTPYFKGPPTTNPTSSAAFLQPTTTQPRTRARHMSIATPQIEHASYDQNRYSVHQDLHQSAPQQDGLQSQSYDTNLPQTQSSNQPLSLAQSQQVRVLMQQQAQTQNSTQALLKQILALQAQYKSEILTMKEEIKNLRAETTEKIDRILSHLNQKALLNELLVGSSKLPSHLLEHRSGSNDLSLKQSQQQQQQQQQNPVQPNASASSSDEDMLFEKLQD